MSALNSVQGILEKHVGPVARKMSELKIVKGLMAGMMATMPVTLGVALLSVLAGLPIPPLHGFLDATGLLVCINDVLVVTMNLGALYMCASVSYNYGKVLGERGISSTVAALGVVLLLIPLGHADDGTTYIQTSYLGSNGLFVALIFALIVPASLSFLMKHMALKLPDSVPQFVSDSLSPMFCAIVIFTSAALIKYGMTMTRFGDVFTMINSGVAAPAMTLGSSPLAVILFFLFCNVLFFFGVHPSVLMSVYMPVIGAIGLANTEAFVAGRPLPYLQFTIMFAIGSCDALGMELALLCAKSERYKALSRIALVPAVFNISEPIMFGTPIAMNPYMFIPYILLKPLACLVATIGFYLGLGAALNPTISMPFVVPLPISSFFSGGAGLVAIIAVTILAIAVLFFPFVKIADKAALEEEAAAIAAAKSSEDKGALAEELAGQPV
ncbi:phosphotransferase system EIIC [Coriobacterium glomerans PW2]|uniref:Permease IIC component n=1 Tax=Coriobacterium glomerans (strain ATCC 49209 / DSM 20642 / JCM 10262 / PW2) TaxID=700015 RepID=F2N938_CORGP|nr:PTS transporter subunit EIIC [Coriobacterium glomerans]AEB07714.1 phosphotransferase system EIIC [Coriobacterium glomerans PW2]